MAGFYDKGYNPSTGLIKEVGGTGKAIASGFNGLTQAGEIKQQANDRAAKLNLEKETKQKEELNKQSIISGMRKMHPKTTKDLKDEEIYVLANKINDVHEDPTNRKMTDVFTAANGDRVGVYDTGKVDKNGKRVYENVSFGKAKDWNSPRGGKKSSTNSEEPLTGEEQALKRAKERLEKKPNSKAAKQVVSNSQGFKLNSKSNDGVENITIN